MNKQPPKPVPPTSTLVRLSQAVYEQLEREVTPIIVSHQTSDIQAGYMLGVQSVLKHLRDGYRVP